MVSLFKLLPFYAIIEIKISKNRLKYLGSPGSVEIGKQGDFFSQEELQGFLISNDSVLIDSIV